MRHKILWVSKIDPKRLIRANGSSFSYLEAISIFSKYNPEISRATNYKEFIDALKINQEEFFVEICIDYHVDDAHTGVDCLKFLRGFCLACNIKMPQITPITATSDERIEMLSVIDDSYKHITDSKEYM